MSGAKFGTLENRGEGDIFADNGLLDPVEAVQQCKALQWGHDYD